MFQAQKEDLLWENGLINSKIDLIKTIIKQSNAMHLLDFRESIPEQGYLLKLPICEAPLDKYDLHYIAARTISMKLDPENILPNALEQKTNFQLENGAFALFLEDVLVLKNGIILFGHFNQEHLSIIKNRNPWKDSLLSILNMDSYEAFLNQNQEYDF